jgi:ribokinase
MGARVVVVGSINVDAIVRVESHPAPGETVLGLGVDLLPGGKGANLALAAASAGADVLLIGRVGDDDLGRR